MRIILANGTELNPILVRGATSFVQGTKRDTLSFIFPASEDISDLDVAFSEKACDTITILGDDETESVYKGYVIRAELKKAPIEVSPETPETPAVMEERITVSMAQRTYIETQLAALGILK